jgi:hypothetical protein
MFVFFVNFFSSYCLILLLIYILFFGSLVDVDNFSRQFATPVPSPYSFTRLVHSNFQVKIYDI